MSKINSTLLKQSIKNIGLSTKATADVEKILETLHLELTGEKINWDSDFFEQGAVYKQAESTYVWTLFDNLSFMSNVKNGSIYTDIKLSEKDYKDAGFTKVGKNLADFISKGGRI